MQEFYSLEEATEWLSFKLGEPVTKRAILEQVEAKTLPVCFRYWGDLGFPLLSASDEPTNKVWLCVFHGYLRAIEFCVDIDHPMQAGIPGGFFKFTRRVNCLQPHRVSVAKELSSDPDLGKLGSTDYSQGMLYKHPNDAPLRLGGVYEASSLTPVLEFKEEREWLFHIDDLTHLLADRATTEAEQARQAASARQAEHGRHGATVKADSNPLAERNARIQARHKTLTAAGHPAPIRALETEFHLSRSQIYRII